MFTQWDRVVGRLGRHNMDWSVLAVLLRVFVVELVLGLLELRDLTLIAVTLIGNEGGCHTYQMLRLQPGLKEPAL